MNATQLAPCRPGRAIRLSPRAKKRDQRRLVQSVVVVCILLLVAMGYFHPSGLSAQDVQLRRFYIGHGVPQSTTRHSRSRADDNADILIDRQALTDVFKQHVGFRQIDWVGQPSYLKSPDIQDELGLSSSQYEQFPRLFIDYCGWLVAWARRTREDASIPTVLYIDKTTPDGEAIKELTDQILGVLTPKQKKHLEKMDRYLWLRNCGVASLLQVVSEDGRVGKLKEIQDAENEIWSRHAIRGLKEWQLTIDRVATLLVESEQGTYYGFARHFKDNPIWADTAILTLEQEDDSPGRKKAWNSELDEIIDWDSHAIIFGFPLDGNFSKRELVINREDFQPDDHLNFLISSSWWETYKTGSNRLNFVQAQFTHASQIQDDISRERQALTKQIAELGSSPVEERLKAELIKAKHALSDKQTRRIYNEVLKPEQQRLVVEEYRKLRYLTMGPYQIILAKEDLDDDIKSLIRDEFSGFRDTLEEIEQECYRELLEIYHDHPGVPRIDLDDRPSYLRPSLFLMIRNAVTPYEVVQPRTSDDAQEDRQDQR